MQQRKLTRLQAVINLIQQKKRISVDDLSKHFNVSLVTIRRDLEELERNGSLIRDYGGAVVNKTFVEEDVLYEKYKINIEEKDKIAKYAASLVKDDDNIILDGGSTTYDKPGKFWVGFNLQKLTIPSKAFFTGISTQNSPITAIINCNASTDQLYNAMLIAVYDAIIDIDTQTKQVVIVS